MYSFAKNTIGGFGAVVVGSQPLTPRNEYVFSFDHGRVFEYNSDSWVLENLRERMGNYGTIVSVDRGLFSDRYVINVIPSSSQTLDEWLSAFDASWKDMGYGNVTFILAETGKVSAQPGGIAQVAPDVGEIAFQTVKPVIPYVLIGGLGLFAIFLFMRKRSLP